MDLVGVHISLLQAEDGHADSSAEPHQEQWPSKCGQGQAFEGMEYGEEEQGGRENSAHIPVEV